LSAACNTYSLTVDNDIRDEYGVTPALGLLAEISQRIHIFPQETFTVDPSQPPVQYRAVMRFCQDKADTLLNTCSPQLKHTAKDALKFSLSGILKMFFYYTKAKQDAGISLGADIPWHPNSKRGSIPCQLRSIFQITPSQLECLRQKVPATAIQIIGQSTQDCNDPNLKWHVRVTFPALTNGDLYSLHDNSYNKYTHNIFEYLEHVPIMERAPKNTAESLGAVGFSVITFAFSYTACKMFSIHQQIREWVNPSKRARRDRSNLTDDQMTTLPWTSTMTH